MSYGEVAQELELRDYIAILRRRWAWVLVPLVLIVALAVYYSLNQSDRYDATARVLLADNEAQLALDPSSQNASFLNRELSNEISLARSDTAVAAVTEEFGEEPTVSISADSSADILIFEGTADDADLAADYANVWANTYVTLKQDQATASLDVALVNLRQQLSDLRTERQELREPLEDLADRQARATTPARADQLQREYDRLNDDLSYELELIDGQASAAAASVANLELRAELSSVGTAQIIQIAAPPMSSSNPPLSRNIVLGAVVGLILGVGLGLLRDNLDQALRTEHDIRQISDVSVLATVPAQRTRQRHTEPALASHDDPHGQEADAFQKVRSALEFASIGGDITSVLVTSANQSEGKTTTASNLAWALASIGKQTLLIDVDFRRPRIHKVYGIDAGPGLADNIVHGIPFAELVALPDDEADNLCILPVGSIPPKPAGFVGSAPFRNAIDWLEEEADTLVLDAPPVLPVSDALTMSTHADAVILTVMARQTTKGDLEASLASLERVGANILGIVLLGVRQRDGYNNYEYRPDQHSPDEHSAEPDAPVEVELPPVAEAELRPPGVPELVNRWPIAMSRTDLP